MAEIRNYPRNFLLKESTYNKLLILAKEMNFQNISVFITRRIITPYYRRIDRERFEKGLIAKEPLNDRKLVNHEEKLVTVHVRLTKEENQGLMDLIKYHNFFGVNDRPQFSSFLAAAIIRMWGDRDEEKHVNIDPKAEHVDVSALNPAI